MTVNALDRILYLETMKDVSEVFRERARVFPFTAGLRLSC